MRSTVTPPRGSQPCCTGKLLFFFSFVLLTSCEARKRHPGLIVFFLFYSFFPFFCREANFFKYKDNADNSRAAPPGEAIRVAQVNCCLSFLLFSWETPIRVDCFSFFPSFFLRRSHLFLFIATMRRWLDGAYCITVRSPLEALGP